MKIIRESGETSILYCCEKMKESVEDRFLEIEWKDNPPTLQYDTDGRWIEYAKYCHHCGRKIIWEIIP